MSEKSDLIIGFVVNVHNSNIVSVDVDGLVSDNQFFVMLSIVFVTVSQHVQRGITYIKLVLPLRQEQSIFQWLLRIDSYNEESKFFLELVCQNVKVVLFPIVNDFLKGTNREMLIKINLLVVDFVNVNGVFWGGYDVRLLIGIRLEELRLSGHWLFEDFFGF
jgi:hypothetical protein